LKTPTCPNCDNDLSEVYWVKSSTLIYDEDKGTYSESQTTITLKCLHCKTEELNDLLGCYPQDDFDMWSETTDMNDVQRRCEYCHHFVPDNDLTDPDYQEGVDGHCNEGGSWDEVGDMTEALTSYDCSAFKLCEILKEQLNELSLDKEGVIQGA